MCISYGVDNKAFGGTTSAQRNGLALAIEEVMLPLMLARYAGWVCIMGAGIIGGWLKRGCNGWLNPIGCCWSCIVAIGCCCSCMGPFGNAEGAPYPAPRPGCIVGCLTDSNKTCVLNLHHAMSQTLQIAGLSVGPNAQLISPTFHSFKRKLTPSVHDT